MYRVLMPVDENEGRSKSQVRYVIDLPAVDDTIEVILLYVFDNGTDIDTESEDEECPPEDIGSVARVIERFEERDIDYRAITDRGDPGEVILNQANELDVDSIVLGGRKRSPTGKVLFGSVTMSVLRNTDIPVVVTGDAVG